MDKLQTPNKQTIEKWLLDPTFFKLNRLDAVSDHVFFEDLQTLEQNDKTLYKSLNGVWKMRFSKNLENSPTDFYKTDFDVSDFDTINVPAHVETEGFDKIQYANTNYPWDGRKFLRPPVIDLENNAVMSYVTFFDLPEKFSDKTVCINLNGVEQAFCIWLNGEFIGYSEDSFTPSHFDLTKHIKPLNNKLSVQVYKRSSAAWIEDQDFFRFSGIFRDVVLYAKPKIHIEDLWVKQNVADDLNSATAEINIKVSGTNDPNIMLELFDMSGGLVFKETPKFRFETQPKKEKSENDIEYFVADKITLDDVKLWDISKPYLYDLRLTVKDDQQNVTECVSQAIGFRRFEIKDSVMYLNKERIIINGVNRHEWHPRKGRAIGEREMLADLDILKKNNITAVRTSHYPNQTLWYHLCDQNGIALMDETNLESHGSWQKQGLCEPSWNVPANFPEWRDCVIDRAVSMFERDKNHPSILWWSCGNEAYAGECITAMGDYFRRKDDTRVVHYEGSFWNRDYDDISDVESRMYAFPDAIEEYLKTDGKKPFLSCEYMHNMGNSLGGMESYIKLVDTYKSCQGGFIWDLIDQAMYVEKNGKEVLCYGGDFADRPSDYNFSGNGIIAADRTEKPAMSEVKYWYSSKEQRELHDRENQKAFEQKEKFIEIDNSKSFELVEGDVHFGVVGENFEVLFSHVRGGPVSLVYGGYEWLYRETKPILHRAPTENDTANGFLQKSGILKTADLYSAVSKPVIDKSKKDEVSVSYTYNTLGVTNTYVKYTVYKDGTIKVDVKLAGTEKLPSLSLFGLEFITQDKIKSYTYKGYSGETYPDRYKGGVYGYHTETTKLPNYLVPQECGCHVYSKFFKLHANDGRSLTFVPNDESFHFSVLPNSTSELESATHQNELPEFNRTFVRIMSKMRGVGGIDTWGADVESEYHISAKQDITLSFYIKGN